MELMKHSYLILTFFNDNSHNGGDQLNYIVIALMVSYFFITIQYKHN